MTYRHRLLRRLRRNERGVAILEFALTAPVFFLLLIGLFDFAWEMYANQVLQGAVAKSARSATLESNASDQTALDNEVRKRVQVIFKESTVTFTRKSYESFDEIGDPEPYTDKNKNGKYDAGECFEDMNGNSTWDPDRGKNGNGGAEDVVLYTAKMKFQRILPLWKMIGLPSEATLTATTVLRNQPFANATHSSTVICT